MTAAMARARLRRPYTASMASLAAYRVKDILCPDFKTPASTRRQASRQQGRSGVVVGETMLLSRHNRAARWNRANGALPPADVVHALAMAAASSRRRPCGPRWNRSIERMFTRAALAAFSNRWLTLIGRTN